VAVITQRLLEQHQPLPKIQVLIYPWLQMANMHTHSAMFYRDKSILNPMDITFAKFILWYLGINDVTDEMLDALESHNHTIVIKDFEKYKKYWDVNKIPEEFKNGFSYYDEYEKRKELYPKHQLHDSNILVKDKNLNSLVQKLVDKDISPLLADSKYLIGLPKAYFLVLEWDTLKDEGLLYAERLKEAGVDVQLAFYDKAFHGIATMVDDSFGFEIAKLMRTDLIDYLKRNL
jgi:acetyl esterase/lipase